MPDRAIEPPFNSLRFAIADPPYLGRAARRYGVGATGRNFGSGPVRAATGQRPGTHGTTEHPAAAEWDDPATHVALVHDLTARFDGWAIAAWPTSLDVYLSAAPPDTRVAVWVKSDAVPSGSRIITSWEPVIAYIPPSRRRRGTGLAMRDVFTAGTPKINHVGAKPSAWTRFVLNLLGYDPAVDVVTDLFPGSGAVSRVAAQPSLSLRP